MNDIELKIGDYIILTKGNAVVDGEVSGWLVAGGEVAHLFLTELEQPFKMIGENAWKVVREGEVDEIQS